MNEIHLPDNSTPMGLACRLNLNIVVSHLTLILVSYNHKHKRKFKSEMTSKNGSANIERGYEI